MNNQNTELETELEIADRAKLVETYEALQRLKENKDFKLVVLEGYLKDSAVDKVSLLGTDYVVQNNLRGQVMEELVSISRFEGYLHMIEQLGAPVAEDDEDFEYADA